MDRHARVVFKGANEEFKNKLFFLRNEYDNLVICGDTN